MIDEFTVVIPHYGTNKELSHLLEMFSVMSVGKLIVVDNNLQPTLEDQVVDAGFDYLHCDKPGSYNARNRAIKDIKSRYIYFIDSDCIITTRHCEDLRKVVEEGHDLVSGEVEILAQERRCLAYYYDKTFSFQNDVNKQRNQAITATLLVRSRLFKELGCFDGDLKSGADIKWTRNATDTGVALKYDKRLNVSHPPREKISEIISKQRRIFGGEILSTKNIALLFFKRLLPPFKKWMRIIFKEAIPVQYKLGLLAFSWFLNFIFLLEFFRIKMGFEAERR
jgi:glycosyltransferase involved in cell wall biosynthesis